MMAPVIESVEDDNLRLAGSGDAVVRRRRVRSGSSQCSKKDKYTNGDGVAVAVAPAEDGPPKKAPTRKTRYGRSATISVTQLLSDSCNSLLQKFRRNPSEKPEKKLARSSTSQQR